MAIDSTFTADTEARLIKIEDALSRIWQLLYYTMNKEQFNRLNAIRQNDFILILARLDALETRVASLETSYDLLL
jgi:hypothetical protein